MRESDKLVSQVEEGMKSEPSLSWPRELCFVPGSNLILNESFWIHRELLNVAVRIKLRIQTAVSIANWYYVSRRVSGVSDQVPSLHRCRVESVGIL